MFGCFGNSTPIHTRVQIVAALLQGSLRHQLRSYPWIPCFLPHLSLRCCMNLQFAGPRTAAFPALLGGGFGFTAEWCCRRASKLCFQHVPWICNPSPWFKTPCASRLERHLVVTWRWTLLLRFWHIWYNMDSEGYESTLEGNITTSESREAAKADIDLGICQGFAAVWWPVWDKMPLPCWCRRTVDLWVCGFSVWKCGETWAGYFHDISGLVN